MKRIITLTSLVCLMLVALMSNGQAQESKKKMRVGIFDNRAIAIAYFGSEFNPLMDKRIRFNSAKAAGDSALIKELEEWGPRFQRQVQFQGYCKVPVDDLLLFVKEKMIKVAEDANLDLIGLSPTYSSANVELVDITDELVALYNPSPKVLEDVIEIRKVEPTELCDIIQVDYNKK